MSRTPTKQNAQEISQQTHGSVIEPADNQKHTVDSSLVLVSKAETLEKFSSKVLLSKHLHELETLHVDTKLRKDPQFARARAELLDTVESAQWSRYRLGKALEAYRAFFKADRGWMEASSLIAKMLCSTDRTVRNIVADYETVKALPENVLEVAQSHGIDLSKRRFQPVVQALEASLATSKKLDSAATERILKDAMQKPKPRAVIDELPFLPLTAGEKARWKIRMKIRTALNNIDTPRKLQEIIAALEEEMFAVWGEAKPITITITPHQSPLTLDGRKRKA